MKKILSIVMAFSFFLMVLTPLSSGSPVNQRRLDVDERYNGWEGNNSLSETPERYTNFSKEYALDFDGDDDYVHCGASSDFNLSDNFTLSAFVNFDTTDEYNMVFNIGFDFSNDEGIRAGTWDGGSMFIQIGTGSSITTHYAETYVSANNWYLIQWVYDGETITEYLDGTEKTSTSHTGGVGFSNSTPAFKIGKRSGDFLDAQVDDLRIYDDELSSSEMGGLNNNEYESLGNEVGWWKFNEGGNSTAYDSSGNKNDGTVYGATLNLFYGGQQRSNFIMSNSDSDNFTSKFRDGYGKFENKDVLCLNRTKFQTNRLEHNDRINVSNHRTFITTLSSNLTGSFNYGFTFSTPDDDYENKKHRLNFTLVPEPSYRHQGKIEIGRWNTDETGGPYIETPLGRTSEWFKTGFSLGDDIIYVFIGQKTFTINMGYLEDTSYTGGDIDDWSFSPFDDADNPTEQFIANLSVYDEVIRDIDYQDSSELNGKVAFPPYNKEFAYANQIHADDQKNYRARPIVEYWQSKGVRADVSVFWNASDVAGTSRYPGDGLEDNETWVDNLNQWEDDGIIRTGLHSPNDGLGNNSLTTREWVIEAMKGFEEKMGHPIDFWIDHAGNRADMGWQGMNTSSSHYCQDIVTENASWLWINDGYTGQEQWSSIGWSYKDVLENGLSRNSYDKSWTDTPGIQYNWTPDWNSENTQDYEFGSIEGNIDEPVTGVTTSGGDYYEYREVLSQLRGVQIEHQYFHYQWVAETDDGKYYAKSDNVIGTTHDGAYGEKVVKDYDNYFDGSYNLSNNASFVVSDYHKAHIDDIASHDAWFTFTENIVDRYTVYNQTKITDLDSNSVTIENNAEETLSDASIMLTKKKAIQKDGNIFYPSKGVDGGGSTDMMYGVHVGDIPNGTHTFDLVDSDVDISNSAGLWEDPDSNSFKMMGAGNHYLDETKSVSDTNMITSSGNDISTEAGKTTEGFGLCTSELGQSFSIDIKETGSTIKWEETASSGDELSYEIYTLYSDEKFSLQRYDDGNWVEVTKLFSSEDAKVSFKTTEHSTNLLKLELIDDDSDSTSDSSSSTIDDSDGEVVDDSSISLLDISAVVIFISILFSSVYYLSDSGGRNIRR